MRSPKAKKLLNFITKNKLKIPIIIVASVLFVLILYFSLFVGRIHPGIDVVGYNLSGKTKEEAMAILSHNISYPKDLFFVKDDRTFTIPLSDIDFNYNLENTVEKAYLAYRTPDMFYNFLSILKSPFNKNNYYIKIAYNQDDLENTLNKINEEVAVKPIYPSAMLSHGTITIEKGKPGEEVNFNDIIEKIDHSLKYFDINKLTITPVIIDHTLSQEEADELYKRANNIVYKTITFSLEDNYFSYTKNDLLALLYPGGGYQKTKVITLINDLALKVNREPQNPVFSYSNGKVQEFTPAKDGLRVNEEKIREEILIALTKLEESEDESYEIKIPVSTTQPDYLTKDVNDLGINELVGRGNSRYTGSIASRIYNISHASSKFNGVLVKPGDVFSFNQTLGDVSEATGYKKAYIIKDGATILGDGGGVCQVSTTLFRAALNAGFPILERQAHAYRVTYYEQDSLPGLDATVYEPSPDLKIKNDTPGHILIQAVADTKAKTLVFEIYGTSDGRVSTVGKSVVTNVTPPPEDLYIDDPTKPQGYMEQIDWKAWGAKVWFDYEVERNGEIIYKKRFYSNFKPWQAKFVRGTGPVQ